MQYREEQRTRNAERRERERRLAGSESARHELEEDWRAYWMVREPIDDIADLSEGAEVR